MSDRSVYLNIFDHENDEHTLERIGGAVLSMWHTLPDDLKDEILSTAENLVYAKTPTKNVRERFMALVKHNAE